MLPLNCGGEAFSDPGVAFTVHPIGVVHTPHRQGAQLFPNPSTPERWVIEVFPRFSNELEGLDAGVTARLLTYHIDPDLECRPPMGTSAAMTFGSSISSLLHFLSPIRITLVKVIGRQGGNLKVQGPWLEDGSPVIDIQVLLPAQESESLTS